jgi:anti-sigma regulatory factor (Ser/Thr protein kinase)
MTEHLRAGRAEHCSTLPWGPQAAGAARAVVRGCLRAWGLDCIAGDAVLAASELAANACAHGAAPAVLRLILESCGGGTALVCEVSDTGPGLPGLAGQATGPDSYAESGRGLALVAALASQVGICPGQAGKTVWFRIDLPAAAPQQAGPSLTTVRAA